VGLKFAVEIKGCYFHLCPVCKIPNGFAKNQKRDTAKSLYLKDHGWVLVEIWEHEWRQDPKACIQRVLDTWGFLLKKTGQKPISCDQWIDLI
jgi:DNA mismatch endonuclease (patch repair protein)